MLNKKIKILVAYHKDDIFPLEDVYFPIHVGKSISSLDLNIQGDDDGENISNKNPFYCELTAIYWAWKNMKGTDIVGLCHYRRYLDFHRQCMPLFSSTSFSLTEFKQLNLSLDTQTINDVSNGSVIVAKAEKMNCTLKQNYYEYHISDDIKLLESIIRTTQDIRFINAFDNVVNKGFCLHPYNIFIMRWQDFDAYCKWLFSILKCVEDAVNIAHYSVYQKRIYGFMAERLFNVWLLAENKHKIEKPLIFINDCRKHKTFGPRKAIREIKRQILCKIINYCYNMVKCM